MIFFRSRTNSLLDGYFWMDQPIALFWFRRDLRLHDNAGLYHALSCGLQVLPLFVFDTLILKDLSDTKDKRISFIYESLMQLKNALNARGSDLLIETGFPQEVLERLVCERNIAAVYTNQDYEPYARQRDEKIGTFLKGKGIDFLIFKDQVVFDGSEILKENGTPYTVFTPYSKRWKATYDAGGTLRYPSEDLLGRCIQQVANPMPDLKDIGFEYSDPAAPSVRIDEAVIRDYDKNRDYPSRNGTSRLSVHLRFGTLSIRGVAELARRLNEHFLNELIWREFYQMILWHYPYVVYRSFKAEYDRIPWIKNPELLDRWKEGMTGYPIVDAGMRELRQTGYMHNRVRMIVASFLTKHLLMDWREGEAHFAEFLLDYELASNNGGWQWAAGCGSDAAPYFRIFNPGIQMQKFDSDGSYVSRWVPEWKEPSYPKPIIDHTFARQRTIRIYSEVLGTKK